MADSTAPGRGWEHLNNPHLGVLMNLPTRVKLPLVAVSAVALTGFGGAVAFALVGDRVVGTSEDAGNSAPIDDNHAGVGGGVDDPATHDAGDDHGGATEVSDDPTPEPSETAEDRGHGADDAAGHDAGDDHGGVRSDNEGDDSADHDAGDDHGGTVSSGSDDPTPEPSETADDHGGTDSGTGDGGADDPAPQPTQTPDNHGGSGSDDGSGHGGDD